jgi:hypothetical protein
MRRFNQISSAETAKSFNTYEEAEDVADEINGTVVSMDSTHKYIVNGEDKLIVCKYFVVKGTWMYFNGFVKG